MTATRWLSRASAPLLGIVVAVGLMWWWTETTDSFAVVPLPTMIEAFLDTWFFDRFWSDLVPSLSRILVGYGLAAITGITLGFLLGLSRLADALLHPLFSFIRSIPPVAIIPPAIFVIGIGDQMKIMIVALVCIWPILLNTADGVREFDETMRATARSYNVSRSDRFWRILLPAVSPRIAAGMRTSLAFSVLISVTSEMIASTNGVGFFVFQSQQGFAVADMWAGIILLALIGIALNGVFGMIESRVLHWHKQGES